MANNSVFDQATRGTYRRLLGSVRPYLWIFMLGILGTILASLTDAGFAYAIKPLINKGFIEKDRAFIEILPLAIILIFIIRGVTEFCSNYFVSRVGRNVVRDFRQKIFQHLLRLPAKFYDRSTSGQLLSLITYNTEQVAEASTFAFLTIVQEGCLVIGYIAVMLLMSWQLTILFLISAPLIAWVIRYSNKRMLSLSSNVQHSMADITHAAEESIVGYRVVRTFGGEVYEQQKFDRAIDLNRARELKIVVTNLVGTSTVQIIAAIPISIILYVATAPHSQISAGSFAALVAAMLSLLRPMRRLTRVNSMIQKGIAGAQSIFDLLDKHAENDTGTLSLKRAKGAIEFQQVNFHYEEPSRPVLKNISFEAKPGETIALVGRSGAGKSTLVGLLPRFYDIESGHILIDGVDIREYHLKDLRSQFAYVSQDINLFNDTVAANIAYGQSSINENQLREVAKAAHALEFIENLPQGFNTQIGDNGVLLSGGQRQRIAIARALLKNAPILILDEATSALDSESERHIQEALEELMINRTTIVIAHRLSTIEKASKIIVLEQGSILEMGDHQELLQRQGHYARLHSIQFREVNETESA